jgi:hypothetical protein
MKKSIKDKPKKRGRPATGRDPMRGIRMPPSMYEAILKWAKKQPDHPTFAEAVRRIISKALGL